MHHYVSYSYCVYTCSIQIIYCFILSAFEVEFNCLYSQPIAALVPNKDVSCAVKPLMQELCVNYETKNCYNII